MFNSMLYPFVAYMVQDFFYPGEESTPTTDKIVSFYAGLVASCFSLAQFFSSMIWGRLSDRIGRRKVILVGLLGNTLTSPLFGLAPTYALAVVARSLSGLINGNLGVAKAYAKEITNERTQAHLFGYMGFSWGLGVIIGPSVGGILSRVSHRFPGVFPAGSFFDQFPYLMPMLACSLISFVGLCIGYFVLEDVERKTSGPSQSVKLHKNRSFMISTSVYAVCGLAFLGFQEVFPFWCKAIRQSGGLGITDESTIGLIQSSGGVSVMVFQILLVPWASNKFGILFVMKTALVICLPVFFFIPFFTYVYGTSLYVGLVVFYLLFAAIQASVLTCIAIAINNSVASELLGTANGIAQGAVSLFRFIGPATYGGIFGWSVDNGLGFPFNSHFIFIVSTIFALLAIWLLILLPKTINYRKEADLEEGQNEMKKPLLEPNSH